MRKSAVALLMIGIILSLAVPVYASDWDKFGKAAAVIEGLRVVTRGNVDIIGELAGLKGDKVNGV